MRPPIIISGGGIIGSYISSRLSRHNIKNYVVEKRPQLLEKSNKIRTLTLNKNSIELLEKEGIIIKNQNVTNINVFDEDELATSDRASTCLFMISKFTAG